MTFWCGSFAISIAVVINFKPRAGAMLICSPQCQNHFPPRHPCWSSDERPDTVSWPSPGYYTSYVQFISTQFRIADLLRLPVYLLHLGRPGNGICFISFVLMWEISLFVISNLMTNSHMKCATCLREAALHLHLQKTSTASSFPQPSPQSNSTTAVNLLHKARTQTQSGSSVRSLESVVRIAA